MSVTLHWFLVIGVVANAATECGQRDGGGKLPVRVIKVDNPYGSSGIPCYSRCRGGVQEFEFCSDVLMWVVPELKQGEITPYRTQKGNTFPWPYGATLGHENRVGVA